jgi:hypothetical protein
MVAPPWEGGDGRAAGDKRKREPMRKAVKP